MQNRFRRAHEQIRAPPTWLSSAGPLARSVCPVASNLVGELVHAGFELRDPAARRPPAANLTADNKMTRQPNFALNAEMKAVAERLTLPAVLVHFFRFAPTAIE